MTQLIHYLSKTSVIIKYFILIVIVNIGFMLVPDIIGGQPLDLLMSSAEAKARLLEMSDQEKWIHIWVTWTLDTIYPLAYGGVIAGLTVKFSKGQPYLLVPILIGVLMDFIENIIQTMALNGSQSLLDLKDILTPLKFSSIGIAILIALVFIIIAASKKLRGNSRA